jgi:hypothetical protein
VIPGRLPGVVAIGQEEGCDEDFGEFFLGFSHWFSRADIRWRALKYLRGLLAPLERRKWVFQRDVGRRVRAVVCGPGLVGWAVNVCIRRT